MTTALLILLTLTTGWLAWCRIRDAHAHNQLVDETARHAHRLDELEKQAVSLRLNIRELNDRHRSPAPTPETNPVAQIRRESAVFPHPAPTPETNPVAQIRRESAVFPHPAPTPETNHPTEHAPGERP